MRPGGGRDPGRLQDRNLSLGTVVLGKVSLDDREIELPEDRFFRFALEQEIEAVLDQLVNRAPTTPPLEVARRDANQVASGGGAVGDLDPTAVPVAIDGALHLER